MIGDEQHFFFLDCLPKNMMEVLTKKIESKVFICTMRKTSMKWTGKCKPSVGFSHLACCYSRKSCGLGETTDRLCDIGQVTSSL